LRDGSRAAVAALWHASARRILIVAMSDVTQILEQIESGDPSAAERLLPVVYDELRKLATAKLAHEKPGQTLQATALVHEAYLRLVDAEKAQHWESRGHFFAAAAESMRRVLVESARRKKRLKRGGGLTRRELNEVSIAAAGVHEDLLELDAALDRLQAEDPQAVKLVHLRYFVGLSIPQAAELLGISPRTADRLWAFARAWLHREIGGKEGT
jgi:RNA polymerase sigma factor (TIGR02999 family)